MMNLETILSSSGITEGCPVPLWKIKVTDDQYASLKEFLIYKYSIEGSFDNCPKEAALYIAEWWKRDTGESKQPGYKNQDIAFCSIGLDHDTDGVDSPFKNARRIFDPCDRDAYIKGAKPVITRRGREFDYSLLFQGGFPLGRASSKKGAGWKRMIEKFVKKNIDFEDLPDAIIAKKALREYKDYLVTAAREQKPEGMPFACDYNHPWYQMAVEGIRIGDSNREAHPFHVKWTFIKRTSDFLIRGTITGPSELRGKFLSSHPEIQEMDSVSIQLFKNEEFLATLVQYEKTDKGTFISYYDIDFSFNYDGVSKMSLRIPGLDKPLLSSEVDLSIPHSFFRASNGQDYEMGSKFGERVSLLVFDNTWELIEANGDHTQIIPTAFSGNPFSMIICGVPQDDSEITFTLGRKGTQDRFSFGSELSPSWTEVRILKPYNPLIVEDVCDFSDVSQIQVLKLSDDEDDGDTVLPDDIFFRRDKSDKWSHEIPFGKIQCSIIKGGVITTPENSLLSVGPNLDINVIRFMPRECHYRISWDQGDVYSADGKVKPDEKGVWIIRKDDYENDFPLTFIPKQGTPFHLHIRTKFRDFGIFTPSGERLQRHEIIPWSEVNSYRYVVRDFSRIFVRPYNELSYELRVNEAGRNEGNTIPSEGSLGLILTPPVLEKYEWRADEGYDFEIRNCYFTLQRYPLSLMVVEEAKALDLVLSSQEGDEPQQEDGQDLVSSFKGKLLVIDRDGNILHEIHRADDGRYYLPDNLDVKVFIACNQRGYVRPVFYENDIISTADTSSAYAESLGNSKLDDPCWNSVTRFMDTGLRYGLPLIDLPWIGSVIKDPAKFLALYCRLVIMAEFDPARKRDVKNIMNRIMSVYKVPFDEMTLDFYLASCNPDCFTDQYAAWMHTYGKNEDNDACHFEFLMWAAAYVQRLITE
jgi:hypothetical protein